MWSDDFWKTELAREDRRLQTVLREGSAYADLAVQKYVFVTAYIVRKLNEAQVLTIELTTHPWPVVVFECTQPPPPLQWFTVRDGEAQRERQPLEQHYDLAAGKRGQLALKGLCNRLVHHFAFEAETTNDRTGGRILFNSDHTKDRLYAIDLDVYRTLVMETHHDEVRWVDMRRDTGRVIKRRSRPASGA